MTKGSLVKMLTGGGLLAVAALGIAVSGSALAQMTPQQQQQLPPSDPSSPQYNTVYLPSQQAAQQQGRWEDRWGAIATDADNAALGAVVDMSSKREAVRSAMQQCEQRGGANCKLQVAYFNQCAAMIVGDSNMNFWRAGYVERAEQLGMAECQKADKNCRVHYSACSLPVRVQ